MNALEAESIEIIREAVATARNPVMLYSIGKDSSVMLHLARKAFYPAQPPFPLLHVDTRWKFQAMYAHRDRMVAQSGMRLISHTNPKGLEEGVGPFSHGSNYHTDVMKTQALKQALDGRLHILKIMLDTLAQPREQLSRYAPKIVTFMINPDKIREVIGPGGKMINKIIADTGVKIDIDDDGRVAIATPDDEAAAKARKIIEGIAKDVEAGAVYQGRVVRVMSNLGAFVELLPGKDGLLHISKLSNERVDKVEDVLNVGDEVEVKVQEIDSQGRVNLIRNDIVYERKAFSPRPQGDSSSSSHAGGRPPRRDGRN